MPEGKIVSFDSDSGTGYIQPDVGGDQIPFDAEVISDDRGIDTIQEGETVVYDVDGGMAGDVAIAVRRTGIRS